MAEDREQGTHEATPRKLEKLREEGKVPKSADVGGAAVVVGTTAALVASADAIGRELAAFTQRTLRLADADQPINALSGMVKAMTPSATPILVASLVAAIAGIAQTRMFSLSMLAFKPERLDPMAQLSQILPGRDTMIELGKSFVKLLVIGAVVYNLIAAVMPIFVQLATTSPLVAAASTAEVATKLGIRAGAALVVLAGFDYWLVLRKHQRDAMMTQAEIKEERKSEEGSPEIRQKIRNRMREMIKSRGAGDLSKATVLVTNPTHYAVALRYVASEHAAPIVIAKGADEVALDMREKARGHRIPIIEKRTLARALWKSGKPGRPIPTELYRAVAEVIAFVMQLEARARGPQPAAAEPAKVDA